MARLRTHLLTALSFLPLALCALLWLRSLGGYIHAKCEPPFPCTCSLAIEDSTVTFSFDLDPRRYELGPHRFFYHSDGSIGLQFYWLSLHEYRTTWPGESSFPWRTLGFHASAGGTYWAITLQLPFWLLTLLTSLLPARRLDLRRRILPQRAFPIEPAPPAPASST